MELPITKDQAFFLNTLGRTAQLYRTTAERMQRDLTDNLDRINKGRVPNAVRPNEAADLMSSAAQIEAMTSIAYAVFPYPPATDKAAYLAHPDTVQQYLQAALNLSGLDYILVKH